MFGLGLCERRNEEQRYICVGMGAFTNYQACVLLLVE